MEISVLELMDLKIRLQGILHTMDSLGLSVAAAMVDHARCLVEDRIDQCSIAPRPPFRADLDFTLIDQMAMQIFGGSNCGCAQ